MNGHVFREVHGVMVQEFDPVSCRVVGMRFQPDDGEHRSLDAVFDEIGFDASVDQRSRKALLAQDLRNLFIPRLVAQSERSMVWQIDEHMVMVGRITATADRKAQVLHDAALIPAADWEDLGWPDGRKLDAWCKKRFKPAKP